MRKYEPKFYQGDRETLVLDNMFMANDCVKYASQHNLNVLFTETTSTSSVEVMMSFKKEGYCIDMFEKKVYAPGGIGLKPDIYVLFTKQKCKMQ